MIILHLFQRPFIPQVFLKIQSYTTWTLCSHLISFPFPFYQFWTGLYLALLCELTVKHCNLYKLRLLSDVFIQFKPLIFWDLIILVEYFFNVHAFFWQCFEIRGIFYCVLLLLQVLIEIIIKEIKDSLITLLFNLSDYNFRDFYWCLDFQSIYNLKI